MWIIQNKQGAHGIVKPLDEQICRSGLDVCKVGTIRTFVVAE